MSDHEALIREARERAKSLAWLGGGGNQEAHVDTDLLRDSARKMSALADALEAHREVLREVAYLMDTESKAVLMTQHYTMSHVFSGIVTKALDVLEGKKP